MSYLQSLDQWTRTLKRAMLPPLFGIGSTLVTQGLDALFDVSLARTFRLVSPSVVALEDARLGFHRGVLVRDLDGHAMRLVSRKP